ncbi:MAG: ParA family protein, partial [Alphaproteobacteria bacterium]|nr:ParA family protein [Alphaproteobacteria bacterium]
SGKGGVGKTMITAAIARELSARQKTLLIDLDFFNRGLTGLLGVGAKVANIEMPEFITGEEEWSVCRVDRNIFHVSYPDLTPANTVRTDTTEIGELSTQLSSFVLEAAENSDCSCVVIDCHGGPDHLSIAACLVADHSILVSEPDRITFHGTLNFLRIFKEYAEGKKYDLRLVFNKVVPSFSGRFLDSFYKRSISDLFDGKPLLAIFPFEIYLTKEFERTTFLTSVYPYSLLAYKTRVLLRDLFMKNRPDLLAPAILGLPGLLASYRRLTLGKGFPLVRYEVITGLLVSFAVVFGIGALLMAYLPDAEDKISEIFRELGIDNDVAESVIIYPISVLSVWFAGTLLTSWSKEIGRRIVYFNRTNKKIRCIFLAIILGVLWFFPILLFGVLMSESYILLNWSDLDENSILLLIVLCVCMAIVLINAVPLVIRVYRNIRYREFFFDDVYAALFVLYILIGPFAVFDLS